MRSRVYSKLGLVFIITSCLLWVAILAVPILRISIAQTAALVASLVVISEVLFWIGILLAGKELAHRYRRQFNPRHWWQRVTHRK